MEEIFLDLDCDFKPNEPNEPTFTTKPPELIFDNTPLKHYQNEVFTCLYHISVISNKQKEIRQDKNIDVDERRRRVAELDNLYKNQRKLFMDCLIRIKNIDPNDSFLRTVLKMHKIDLVRFKDSDMI